MGLTFPFCITSPWTRQEVDPRPAFLPLGPSVASGVQSKKDRMSGKEYSMGIHTQLPSTPHPVMLEIKEAAKAPGATSEDPGPT